MASTKTISKPATVEVLDHEPVNVATVQAQMQSEGVKAFMQHQMARGAEALYNLCTAIRLYIGEDRPAADNKKVIEITKWLGQTERTVINNWRVGEFVMKHNLGFDDLTAKRIPISVVQAKGPRMLKAADLKEATAIAHEKPKVKTPVEKAKDAERKQSAALDAGEEALNDKEKATALFTQIAPAVLPHFAEFVGAVGSPLKAVEALDTLITRFLELAKTAKAKKPATAKS